jgi:cytochrome c biogenesis protein CcmG/thiol:disulfide interchange protein DsbE
VYEKYHPKGFELISVNASWDKDAAARKFVQDYRFPFPVGRDSSGTIGGAYSVDATPASFFIDKKGVLVERVEGEFESNAEGEFSRRIEKLLAQ